MVFRTDLAVEARELLEKDIGGTDYFTQRYGDVTLTRLKIKTPEAAGKMGKPEGTYLTFDVPPFSDDFRDPAARIELIEHGDVDILDVLPRAAPARGVRIWPMAHLE